MHVLDTVRTRLLQFVLEIEDLNPGAGAIPSLEHVSSAATHQVFEKVIMMNENYHGDVQKIEDVYGSNIATGQARISSSRASYTSTADATAAFEALKTDMDEVSPEPSELSMVSPEPSMVSPEPERVPFHCDCSNTLLDT